jgi:primosomal protein N' (replication factor Y)
MYNYDNKNNLSIEQKKAFETIQNTQKNTMLLYGLTGSGKTEIYIHLIKKTLDT